MLRLRFFFAAVLMALSVPDAGSVQAAEKIKVVASFSIIADLVRQVGGERVEVKALVPQNRDTHLFQPSPADAKTLLGAKLFVINGLGLELWTDRMVKASGYKGSIVVASKGIKALRAEDDHGHSRDAKGKKWQGLGRYDPHAWQEVAHIKIYIANLRNALVAADPEGRADYEKSAAVYLQQLDALDTEIKQAFAGIPKSKRRIITSHQAFHYYGAAYDIEFFAPQGMSGASDPSARDVANLIRQIKQERVKTIFMENISNPRLIEQIARETGATLGGTLYSDALSDSAGPAGTYLDMMRHNTRLLAGALKQ